MANIEKKKRKLEERIEFLEEEMRINLRQKTSNTAEINILEYHTKIQDLKKKLQELK